MPHDKKLAVQQARTLDEDIFAGAENTVTASLPPPPLPVHHQSATTTLKFYHL